MSEWFVLNARDARWRENELGALGDFEKEPFDELGIYLNVLEPGQPMGMYHREAHQEDFLVLRGECLLIVEGREVGLKEWDLVHCPPDVAHMIVGAGDGTSLVLAVGSRIGPDELLYPVDPVAAAHGACAERETSDPAEAYARFTRPRPDIPFREEFLSG